MSGNSPSSWRLSGMYPTPRRIASRGDAGMLELPPMSTRPRMSNPSPRSARATSVCPIPSNPQRLTISPRETVNPTSCTRDPICSPDTCTTGCASISGRGARANAVSAFWPSVSSTSRSTDASSRVRPPTRRPFRSTVHASQISRTSR